MNKQVKKKWLEALRSGKYSQGRCHLRDKEDNFCCLGVLCDIATPKNHTWEDHGQFWKLQGPRPENSYFGALPPGFQQAIHISDKDQAIMINMNDTGKSFEQIADWIEKRL